MKPGYKTTEFWLTLGTFITSGLYLFGAIGSEEKNTLTTHSNELVESISIVIAQLIVLLRYISARAKEKNNAEIKENNKEKETDNGDDRPC